MRRKISFILIFVFLLNLFIIPFNLAFAAPHELQELNINVFLNEDGSARITEQRISHLSEGTENYIGFENLADSEFKDFRVIEDGVEYEYIEDWDIDASREEKAFKNGIIKTNKGYELAWGIGEYGPHNVILEYTVTNIVKNFPDAQGMFWEFSKANTNIPPQRVNLVIESKQDLVDTNSNIWAFGFEGAINFIDGKIVAESTSPLSRSNFVEVLIEFEEPLFNTNSYFDTPFEEIKDSAFQGSDYSEDSGGGPFSFLEPFLFIIIPLFIMFSGLFVKNVYDNSINRNIKLKRKFKEEYYRDYPYEGNFEDTFYILNKSGITSPEMLITAFILKWINLGWIDIRKEEVGFLFKKEETSFKFLRDAIDGSDVENTLFSMMRRAAGSNEILENNEFSKWSKKNYQEFQAWERSAFENSKSKMKAQGYLETTKEKFLFISTNKLTLTQKGQELEDNVYRFINFLYDFSILNEREAVNVNLWDNLMIWAGLLGITEVVNEEFKKLYPAYETESHYRGNGVYTAYIFANSATRSYTAAARSSGSGGSTSIGGGGGSFGGGGGGGTR